MITQMDTLMTAPKLPTPLPYDYVDEYIDSRFYFIDGKETYDGCAVIIHHCDPRANSDLGQSFPQLMIDLKTSHYESEEEDEYLSDWDGSPDSMYWKAEWTDEDTETYIDTQIYS